MKSDVLAVPVLVLVLVSVNAAIIWKVQSQRDAAISELDALRESQKAPAAVTIDLEQFQKLMAGRCHCPDSLALPALDIELDLLPVPPAPITRVAE
jgi:hypothetical protein